jgi:hypothetical protein
MNPDDISTSSCNSEASMITSPQFQSGNILYYFFTQQNAILFSVDMSASLHCHQEKGKTELQLHVSDMICDFSFLLAILKILI